MARILVADDHAEQVYVLGKLLESFGYEVTGARSPLEAIVALEESQHDLLVLDLRFPQAADGMALIREVRRRSATLPLIVLSGWPDDLYGTPEEEQVSRIVLKGSTRDLLETISELLMAPR